jgi:flavin-dependent dehydrogenase
MEIFDGVLPRKAMDRITVNFGDKQSVSFKPQAPIVVVSRRELGQCLLEEAGRSGVRLLRDRVTKLDSKPGGWQIAARENVVEADYLVGADGSGSLVRRTLGKPLPPEDLCITLGYYILGNVEPNMKVFFLPAFEGYIWSFPRLNHISYGLITRAGPGRIARAKELLENFIVADLGKEVMERAEFYSAPVPCLGPRSWKSNVIAGNRWALVGDAAGLVDPITGEGIYFALRSAEILAGAIDRPEQYPVLVWNEIGRELAQASRMYRKFYTGRFLGGDFRKRVVQMARRSRTVQQILENLMGGQQSYSTLKRKLLFSVPSVGWDLVSGRR